jgi:hypothetical protein
MIKNWIWNTHDDYTLLDDKKEIGNMVIKFWQTSHRAICTIDGRVLNLKRAGRWKSTIGIYDSNDNTIIAAFPDKLYGNTYNIEYENKEYKLIIRNNPLMEYVIIENGIEILIYSLVQENEGLRFIVSTSNKSNYFLDFLLWFMFLPFMKANFPQAY